MSNFSTSSTNSDNQDDHHGNLSDLSIELRTMFQEVDKVVGHGAPALERVAVMLDLTARKQLNVHQKDLEHPVFTELTECLLRETQANSELQVG